MICRLFPSHIRLTVATGLALSLLISGAYGQTCPMATSAAEPIILDSARDLGCGDITNGRSCAFACYYQASNRPANARSIAIIARWLTHRTGRTINDGCETINNVGIYPNRLSSRFHSRIDVTIPFYQQFSDPLQRWASDTGAELLKQMEDRGLPCLGSAPPTPTPLPLPIPSPSPTPRVDPPHQDHASICRRIFSDLNKLRFKSVEINAQLRYLTDAMSNPTAVRDQLSLLDQYVRAIADANYNGPHKDTLDRMRNSAADRASFAAYYGIESDNDPGTLIRRARQTTANRLEYQNSSAAIIARLNIDKQLTEKEIARLRLDVLTRNCGGDTAGCDISGRWNFFAVGEDVREYWTLTQTSAGRYRAKNEAGSREGDAEVFVNDVALNEMLLSWKSGGMLLSIFGGSFRITLKKGCQDGTGERFMSGVEKPTAITAYRDASNSPAYVNDKNYDAIFEGQRYQTLYSRQMNHDIPIDVFFFKILAPDGSHAVQKGEKIWGRFVRQPSVDHPDQSKVTWWAVTWRLVDRSWVESQRTVASVEILPAR